MKQPAVYIIASKCNGTLYIGVTSNLIKRIYEHKNKLIEGFTSKYDCDLFVYYEIFDSMQSAIDRETQIKSFRRIKKLQLIEKLNPEWDDLYSEILRY